MESSFKQFQWIKESSNVRPLAGFLADGRIVGHELLDELPPSRNVHYGRQMITQTGVLLERHEDLARLSE
ncbi:hypothetical protein [Amycolatopsis sp. NPDC059021]|uniref:hypothetical protein n=1 Tax=Amycolatopsis sp. NPDC059021 TaxID=3346704 RepID=UPI00366BDD15